MSSLRGDADQRQGGGRWDLRSSPWSLWQGLEAISHWPGPALLVGSAGPRTQGACLTPASAPQTWDQVTSLPWENPWFSFESPEGPGRGHGSTRAQPGGARRDRSPPPPVPTPHTPPLRGADSEEHQALSWHQEVWRARLCFCPVGPP